MSLFADTPAPEEEKLFQKALRFLAIRPRSVKEMTEYLAQKNPDPLRVTRVIDRLNQCHYLDDDEFARIFIENRKRHHPKSRFALAHELKQKGIQSSIIEKQLENHDDAHLACRALSAKFRQWHHLTPDVRQKKAFNFLRYRGFDYETIRFAWEQVSKGTNL